MLRIKRREKKLGKAKDTKVIEPEVVDENTEGGEHSEQSAVTKKEVKYSLPLVYDIKYPYQYGDERVVRLICEKRPTARLMKKIMQCGDDESEAVNYLFEELWDCEVPKLDMMAAEDMKDAIALVKAAFPNALGGN